MTGSQKYILVLIVLLLAVSGYAQNGCRYYNVDSLFRKLSANKEVKSILQKAGTIYKAAGISKSNISSEAFKMAFLEKCFLDSGRVHVLLPKDSTTLPYSNFNILTIVDYTKNGKAKRFITVDLIKKKILHNTLVSHGSATGFGSEQLINNFGWKKENINSKYAVPLVFGNAEGSARSSLGLVLTIKGDNPDNLCHLCKDFLKHPHKDVVILSGLEKGINDNDVDREIVIHTTGSKDFSDSVSMTKIGTIINLKPEYINGLKKNGCNCTSNESTVAAYASACGIADNKGFIGRSAGCLVLPEAIHIPIMKTIEAGSLVFVYSNVIAPTGTNYFEESPIIKEIVDYSLRR